MLNCQSFLLYPAVKVNSFNNFEEYENAKVTINVAVFHINGLDINEFEMQNVEYFFHNILKT